MFRFTVDTSGMKKFQRRLSPARYKEAQRHALTISADYIQQQLENVSRRKTGRYAGSWRKSKISEAVRRIENVALDRGRYYPIYVTGSYQATTASPKGAAGENFMASMKRRIGSEVHRRTLKAFIEVMKR